MDDDRLWDSLVKLHDKVDKNTNILTENTADLKHHILRTDLLQQNIENIDIDVKQLSITQQVNIKILKIVAAIIATSGIIITSAVKLNLF